MSQSVSVIIPTYNMSIYLAELWATIVSSGLSSIVQEVIFVDDASTDNSVAVIESFIKSESTMIRLIKNSRNLGRYESRKIGALAAKGMDLLFLDTRVSLPDDFGKEFLKAAEHKCAMCMVEIKVEQSVFNLYWQRTHEFIFRRHFYDAQKGFYINSLNYENYVKGTGGFFCSKSDFLDACGSFTDRTLKSDDTYLLKVIAAKSPIWVDARWRIIWEPRQDLNEFLDRLWERGPGFAEYHIFAHKGLYFKVVTAALSYLLLNILLLLFLPIYGKYIFTLTMLGALLSTALISKSVREFFRMCPLHVMVCGVAVLSIIRGIYIHLKVTRA